MTFALGEDICHHPLDKKNLTGCSLERNRVYLFSREGCFCPMNIAIVEDDTELCGFYSRLLQKEGYGVTSFQTARTFIDRIHKEPVSFDLVLCDYRLPDMAGLDAYVTAKRLGLRCPFVLMSAYGDFDVAVKALKAGIADYLIKPMDKEIILQKVASYLQPGSLDHETLFNRFGKGLIAQSPVIQKILNRLTRSAESKASILLCGESGTGKEVIARMVHSISPRSAQRFVAVNVSAIPDTLFEAEFFGYRKGAFTDALRDHEGHARSAKDGTLFLDEIGEMSLSSQAKLLRLLEDRKVQPLGSMDTFTSDFRVISASNKDLMSLVREGRFRDDLYYRLAVISISIPPLRERPEDIIPLARYLMVELSKEEGIDIQGFAPEAQDKLLSYSWPGNVRELKNRIHEAILATDNTLIETQHLNLPGEMTVTQRPLEYEKARAHFEKRYALRLLRTTRGNINRAAKLSGLSRKAIYELLKRNSISLDLFRR